METVTLTIDGREVTVEKGRTVLQAAIEHGYQVPYYCYHPGLGVDGSCRVCIVKIEKMPKLQTSCSTLCADGMVVQTRTPEVVDARASVFEFLLINHPLDCPVCDKGGECPLQDFSYTFGPNESRMDFSRRVFDGEGVKADVDFGPTLMLNRNRCILCTRCVRFMDEVDGDAQISIIDRGSNSEIATFQEEGVHSLLSGNLMDVCPVGAITTRDYRFKSRPWDNPAAVDTICTLCSKGCNTTVWLKGKPEWAKGSRLVRITPRFNPDINGYWMCDIGRFDYHWIEGDNRVRQPLVRDDSGAQTPASWDTALTRLRGYLGGDSVDSPVVPGFLISGHASVEELFILRRLTEALGTGPAAEAVAVSWTRADKPQPARVQFRVPAIEAPNLTGARDLGFAIADPPDDPDDSGLQRAIAEGGVTCLYVVDPGPAGSIGDVSWAIEARRSGPLAWLIVQAAVESDLTRAADCVLPGVSFLEKEASYVNEQARLQRTRRVIEPPGDAREDWEILIELAAALGTSLHYVSLDAVRRDIWMALTQAQGYAEITRTEPPPSQAGHWLQASNPSERWKWNAMFQDLPPVKGACPSPASPPEPEAAAGKEE